jgi:LacI family transcriptional regulator
MFLEPRALMTSPPSWLKSWKGDVILARISDANIGGVVFKISLPAVNLSSAIPNLGFLCIETDPDRLASLALAHLLERGLRRFGLLGDDTSFRNWSKQVQIPFLNMVRAAGHDCDVFDFPSKSRAVVP